MFEVFRAPRSGDFSTARFYAYRSVTAAPNTQILARFDAGTPALVERKVGSGHVMLWASTLDSPWSDLPLKPVFLPFIHRSMVHLANYTEPSPWLTIGQVFDPDASSAKAQASGRLALTPSGKRLPLEDEGSQAQVLELTEQGFYEIRGQKANSDVTVVASNIDPAESDLTALDPEVVAAATGGTGQNGQQAVSDVPLTPQAQERSNGSGGICWRQASCCSAEAPHHTGRLVSGADRGAGGDHHHVAPVERLPQHRLQRAPSSRRSRAPRLARPAPTTRPSAVAVASRTWPGRSWAVSAGPPRRRSSRMPTTGRRCTSTGDDARASRPRSCARNGRRQDE